MSVVTKPRGPLSARVYWTRRLVALGVALAMVFGISYLLGGGGQQSGSPSARPAAASSEPTSAGLTPSAGVLLPGDKKSEQAKKKDRPAKPTKTPLAVPTGTCEDTDVKVVPSVDGVAYAGKDVTLTLNLTTLESPACTWQVSADSVVLKLTSGTDRIWTTQECEEAIASQSVVVRKDDTTTVDVTWSGQRSDENCTTATLWAQPGYYHVSAAAYGAEPEDYQFELVRLLETTTTPKPKADKPKRANAETKKAQTKKSETKKSEKRTEANEGNRPGSAHEPARRKSRPTTERD